MLELLQLIINNANAVIEESYSNIEQLINGLNHHEVKLQQTLLKDNINEIMFHDNNEEKILQIDLTENGLSTIIYDFTKNLRKTINAKLYSTDIYTAYFIFFKCNDLNKPFEDVLNMNYTSPKDIPSSTLDDIKKYDELIIKMEHITDSISNVLQGEFTKHR